MIFREGTPADRDAILDLRRIAFPGEFLQKQHADFWEWEFVRGPAGPGRTFVVEADNRIVAHLGFVPQRYDVSAVLAVDAMVDPGFRRRRAFSELATFAAARLRRDFQVAIGFQIRRISLPGMLAGGWTVAGQVPVLLRPTFMGKTSDAVKSVDDLQLLDDMLATDAIRQKRTAEFLRWRYLENPHWRHTIEGWFAGDRPIAFIVHRETVLRGVPTLAIADAGGDEEAVRKLVRHACARSRVLLAAAFFSRAHPAWRAIRRSGFVPGPHRFNLLVQVFDEDVRLGPWSLSWGDTDHV
jgi:Acetyltransferase (GNAT) domain